jgi:hypothetical protein
MEVSKLTVDDINRRVVWQQSPHLEKYGRLKAFMREGFVIVELDKPGKGNSRLQRVPAKDVRFIDERK